MTSRGPPCLVQVEFSHRGFTPDSYILQLWPVVSCILFQRSYHSAFALSGSLLSSYSVSYMAPALPFLERASLRAQRVLVGVAACTEGPRLCAGALIRMDRVAPAP